MSSTLRRVPVGANQSAAANDKDLKKYTLYIRPDVMKQVKIRAIHEDTSYSSVVEQAIEAYLKRS